MKSIQIITLIALALLSSCSFLRLQDKVVDFYLKETFEEQLHNENPDIEVIEELFKDLEIYSEKVSNPLLAFLVKMFESKVEEFAENILSGKTKLPKGETAEKAFEDYLRPLYKYLMANYEHLLLVDEKSVGIDSKLIKLSEDNKEIRDKLKNLAIYDEKLSEKLESIRVEYENKIMSLVYLYETVLKSHSYLNREITQNNKYYALLKQENSELSSLLKSFENDS